MPGKLKLKNFAALFFIYLALYGFFPAGAQYQQYQFSRLDNTKGLPHNDVNCFFRDDKGFLWVGTLSGLARFDGNNFKTFRHNTRQPKSISDDDIRDICEGPDGKLWIETRAGVDLYDPSTDSFHHDLRPELLKCNIVEANVKLLKKTAAGLFLFGSPTGLYIYDPVSRKTRQVVHRSADANSISAGTIIDITEDKDNNLWMIHIDGTLELLDHKRSIIVQRFSLAEKFLNKRGEGYRIFLDRQGLLWVYNMSVAAGLYTLDPISRDWMKFSRTGGARRLNSDMISGVVQDEKDNIWVATDHGGINLVSKPGFKVDYLLNKANDNKSLSQNSISSIYSDRLGVVWIGTFRKGINLFHPGIIKFGLIKHSSNAEDLGYNDVNSLAEDGRGNLWIGTNGRGLTYYDRATGKFSHFQHQPSNPVSLSHDAVVSTYFDREGRLWVGTYTGGLNFFQDGKFRHFLNDPRDPGSLSDNRVSDLLEDSKGRFWVGTSGGGLNLLDKKNARFKRYTEGNQLIGSDYVFKIIEDHQHNIWVGTSFGIHLLLEKEDRFVRFVNDPLNGNSLINDNVNSLIEDKRGYLWICTRDGLSVYNPKTAIFQNFTKLNGLPDNNLTAIQQDSGGNFWLSSSNGLSRISVKYGKKLSLVFDNFDENDGLQGKEFNRNASVGLRTGELAFGGPDGVNIFFPSRIKTNAPAPKLFITDFQLFGESVSTIADRKGKAILEKSIVDTREIVLDHDQNVFAIEFAALNFTGPDEVRYQYMLEEFDKTWIEAGQNTRKAAYTNLPPGKYRFKVRSQGPGSTSNIQGASLVIIIRDPWYTSPLAYFLYLLIAGLGFYYIRHRGIQRLKREFSVEQQKIESQRLLENERIETLRSRELDALKIKFLTNISHEFRTPLSLILAPIDKILTADYDSRLKEQVSLIHKNAKRLLNLVNQLLDFREMEMKELKLQKRKGEIVSFIREATYSFKDVGEKKNIQLSFNSAYDVLNVKFDHDKLERILFNLLSNSFKFTPEGGKVSVSVDCLMAENYLLEIKIMDTGIGVPKQQQEKIFESFFQHEHDDSIINQGSGIGLSITKEFINLHQGQISLESDEGLGSCFTVLLPFEELRNQIQLRNDASKELITDTGSTEGEQQQPQISSKKPTVLIVEDDTDLRFFLRDSLKTDFNVIEAQNGKEGWQKALFYHPDIVVSDISMPLMDGIDLCMKIKSDARTSQVPVILLTALTAEHQQLEGLETGANDYMTKPFSFEVLRSKIRNILSQQESSRKRFSKQVEVSPPTVELESPDEQFLREVLAEIEKNIDNSNFSVDMLSKLVLVSRGTLYTRMVALTGKTPLEFIKSYRLKRAAQLLAQGKFNVSTICYKTGFKTTKNFVKSFKEEFNVLPSQYAEMRNSSGQ